MRAVLIGLFLSLAGLTPALAMPAPDIVGKSVSVSWTEIREVRAGGGPPRSGPVSFQLSIYLSSAGRPFSRITASSRVTSATGEHVGSGGSSLGGGVRSTQVNGRSINVQTSFGNYARRIHIDVASGAGSCSVQISIGKEVGSAPKAFQVNGVTLEVLSTTVSSSSCTTQDGNVFGR